MTPLRWAAIAFLAAGIAAAPLNLLHAHFFSGGELARVPLARSGTSMAAQAFAPLILGLKPDQSPVAVFLEAGVPGGSGDRQGVNRYLTHLINGNQIAAKADAVLMARSDGIPRTETLTLLRTKINTEGVYSVLVSEAVAPAMVLSTATLIVRANTRRADVVNVLAGIAFMLIGVVTLFATGKRRVRRPGP